jgi:hypothetical protein
VSGGFLVAPEAGIELAAAAEFDGDDVERPLVVRAPGLPVDDRAANHWPLPE